MTIRGRLFLSLGLLLAGVFAALAASLLLLGAAQRQLAGLRDEAVTPVIQIGIVRDAYSVGIVDTAVKVRNGLVDWTDARLAVDGALAQIERAWTLYRRAARDPEELRLAGEVDLRRRAAETAILMLQDALEDRDVPRIGRFVDEVMYPSIDPISQRLAILADYKTVVSDRIAADAESALERFQLGIAALLAFLLTVACYAAWTVQRRVVRPLDQMTAAMTAVAGGNLDQPIPGQGFRDEISRLAQALVTFRDSARALERARSDAARQQALLQAVLDTVPLPLFYKDAETRFLGFNAAFAQAFDAGPALIGQRVQDMDRLTAADREFYQAENERVVAEAGAVSREVTLRFADGGTRHTLYFLRGFRNADGTPGGLVGAFVDISDQKRMMAELGEAKQLAEAATQAKSSFLATMSHEIRTPMNGVMSMAELLELTPLDGEQRRMARVIRESAQALLTVINDILDFSKIEAGKLDIEAVPFSLADVVEGVGELLAPRADDKALELVLAVDPALADARLGDPTRVRQVLLNLGGNAVKFTHDGSVGMTATTLPGRPNWVRFEVRDTGIGLTPPQLERLFKPFEQADTSTARKYGGTGLGLSICQRLCELMGGRIGVDSVAGQGSCFWFELPLPPAGTDAAATAAAGDYADLRVALVGLPAVQRSAAEHQLAGLAPAALTALPTLAAVAQALEGGAAFDLVVIDARCPDGPVLDAPARLDSAGTATFALVAPRALVSTLDAAARAQYALALTYPLGPTALRRAADIALGRGDPAAAEAGLRADMAFAPPPVDAARAAGALILVAEDNATNQLVIRQMLARMGFACEIGENGAVALAMYERGRYGLLLTDFHMPEMDGFELTGRIRSLEADGRPRLPIIALTADALTGTEQQCLDAGMDGYLTKPVNSRALGAMLERWLPQALPLRQPAQAAAAPAAAAAAAPAAWDPDIFDPAQLAETFGAFDAEAKSFLQAFVADAGTRLDDFAAALAAGDLAALRHHAHAVKGAARSVGAVRLGNIASDIQDACDAGDTEMAGLMTELLRPTWDELNHALPAILAA